LAAALQRKGMTFIFHATGLWRGRRLAEIAACGTARHRPGVRLSCRFHIKPPSCEFVAWITDPILRI